MGHVFKPQVTMAVPPGAEILERNGERFARWRNAHGKLCTREVRTTARGDRIAFRSGRYLARYRDADGVTQTVATGCRDESAARTVLVELERRAELVRSGVLTTAQDAAADHKRSKIGAHLDAYLMSLRAKGDSERHCKNVRRLVTTVVSACKFHALRDVKREPVERWLASGDKACRSARTRNTYLAACKWFLNWCVDTERLVANPLARIQPADEKSDRRRQPRALTPDELVRLLDAARRRPLTEALKFNRGWRKNQPGARLRPETRVKLDSLGHGRALIYKTLVLTGLRLGELASIRVCDVHDDHIVLDARHEKNRQGSIIPLRADLAEDLRLWIANRRSNPQPTDPLFDVSINLVKVLDRDLEFAGIAKRDERNRTACVHSLRHTFATLMSRGGVAPRTAQAAMRHSTIDLTMSVYTDPKLLDVVGALDALPGLPLDGAASAGSVPGAASSTAFEHGAPAAVLGRAESARFLPESA
jgi:integrase